MSNALFGHRIEGKFVCMDCIGSEDHREGGITNRGGSVVYARTGSGRECSRCEKIMPSLATVAISPDGYQSIHAPDERWPERAILCEREESVLVRDHALVRVSIGNGMEVGLRAGVYGKLEVWVHEHFSEGEPIERWECQLPRIES